MKSNIQALVAAVIAGVVGYFAFGWIRSQGFYALILPGALIGLAASHFRSKSIVVCAVCGVMALGLGLFTEWRHYPFLKDRGFGYFLTHVHDLKPVTMIMIVVGTIMGFWFPFAHRNDTTPS